MQIQNLAENVVRELIQRKMKVSTAESCTGGMIASALVGVEGCSQALEKAFILYSEDAKMEFAGVKKETLATYGVVSSQVAEEMAVGCGGKTGADLVLSSTGLAGPGGGTPEKPVGLVYIGCCYKGKCETKELRITGDREEIRRQATKEALMLAYKLIFEETSV